MRMETLRSIGRSCSHPSSSLHLPLPAKASPVGNSHTQSSRRDTVAQEPGTFVPRQPRDVGSKRKRKHDQFAQARSYNPRSRVTQAKLGILHHTIHTVSVQLLVCSPLARVAQLSPNRPLPCEAKDRIS